MMAFISMMNNCCEYENIPRMILLFSCQHTGYFMDFFRSSKIFLSSFSWLVDFYNFLIRHLLQSYMDFLIISLLCFNHNLPLPAIATGMDFMASKFLGETLRRCGSFFMKRQFGKVLTWTFYFMSKHKFFSFFSSFAEFFCKFIDD